MRDVRLGRCRAGIGGEARQPRVDRDQEVPELVWERTGEEGTECIDIDELTGGVDGHASRGIHPRVCGEDSKRAEQPGGYEDKAHQEMDARRQTLPAVEIDPDED